MNRRHNYIQRPWIQGQIQDVFTLKRKEIPDSGDEYTQYSVIGNETMLIVR